MRIQNRVSFIGRFKVGGGQPNLHIPGISQVVIFKIVIIFHYPGDASVEQVVPVRWMNHDRRIFFKHKGNLRRLEFTTGVQSVFVIGAMCHLEFDRRIYREAACQHPGRIIFPGHFPFAEIEPAAKCGLVAHDHQRIRFGDVLARDNLHS